MSLSIWCNPSSVRARFLEGELENMAGSSSSGAVLFPGRCFMGVSICFTGDDGVSGRSGGARRRGDTRLVRNIKEGALARCAELEQGIRR
jgi:hypothetical protein